MDYLSTNYDDKKRWVSYWHQIDEILQFSPRSALVIGKGNGLVSEYLKLKGIKTVTLDVDASLNPDIVASVLNIPAETDSFDVVLCAQVLEHLPFNDFEKALLEMKRVAKTGVILSLPHFGPAIRLCIKLPLLPESKLVFKLPYPIKHKYKGEHYWEIGKRGYSIREIKKTIENFGFLIKKNYIVFENPLHRFFILKKSPIL